MTNTSDNSELEQLIHRVAYAMKTMAVPMYPKDDEQPMVELELAERAVRSILKDWFESMDGTLTEMIKDWESRMEGEETFYTLGIRRVQDMLRGDKSIGTP
jgi:hypothetical protein